MLDRGKLYATYLSGKSDPWLGVRAAGDGGGARRGVAFVVFVTHAPMNPRVTPTSLSTTEYHS